MTAPRFYLARTSAFVLLMDRASGVCVDAYRPDDDAEEALARCADLNRHAVAMEPAPPLPCSIDGCDRPRESRGWCYPHYRRWHRHGDPQPDQPIRTRALEAAL